MAHIFTMQPDFTPYEALPNLVPLDQMNPPLAALTGAQRYLAEVSLTLDLSGPDRADENKLNQIIWHSAKGYDTPYPKKGIELLLPNDQSADLSLRVVPLARLFTGI
jgi:hypothetical protein